MTEAVSRGRGARDEGRESEMPPDTVPRQTQMGLREMTPVPSVLNPAIESCSNPTASESPEQFRASVLSLTLLYSWPSCAESGLRRLST